MSFLAAFLDDHPAYPVPSPKPPLPDHWEVKASFRDAPSLSRPGAYTPENLAPISSIRSMAVVGEVMSPRPVSYLRSLRCSAEPYATALDHALVEILLSAAYEADPTMTLGSVSVPVVSVLSILGWSRNRLRELKTALDRLTRIELVLDLGHKTERRQRRKVSTLPVRPKGDEPMENVRRAMARLGCSDETFDAWHDDVDRWYRDLMQQRQELYPELSEGYVDGFVGRGWHDPEARAFRDAMLTRFEQDFDIFFAPERRTQRTADGNLHTDITWHDHASAPLGPAPEAPLLQRTRVVGPLTSVPRPNHAPFEKVVGDDGRERYRFSPLTRHVIARETVGDETLDVLHYELSSILCRSLDRTRQEAGRFTRYAYVDLRSLASFKSRYTPGLYRWICAEGVEEVDVVESYAEGQRPVSYRGRRHGALMRRPQIRIGDWSLDVPFERLVEIVDYRFVKGGRVAQVRRGAFEPIARDLAKIGRDDHRPVLRMADAGDVHIDVLSVPNELRLRQMSGHELSAKAMMPPLKGLTPERIAREEQLANEVAREMRLRIAPRDVKAYQVSLGTWLRIGRRLGYQTTYLLRPLSVAWQLAIEEMLSAGVPHFGDLTGVVGDLRDPSSTTRAGYIEFHGEDAAGLWIDRPVEEKPRLRGERLQASLLKYGVDRTAVRFALEEAASPDLSLPCVARALENDGTVKAMMQARLHRLNLQTVDHENPVPSKRRQPVTGLRGWMRVEMDRLAQEAEQETPLQAAVRMREEKRREAQARFNRRRKKARAAERLTRAIREAQSSKASTT